jgi:hypothetical protein
LKHEAAITGVDAGKMDHVCHGCIPLLLTSKSLVRFTNRSLSLVELPARSVIDGLCSARPQAGESRSLI